MGRTAERHERLWMLAASPTLWAAHFGLCYITAAVWCAKAPDALTPLGTARVAVIIYTIVALARFGAEPAPHDADSPADRHRFMGLATVLLSGLSALAVVYAALVVMFIETCQ
jgi:hypothetical protein